MFNLRRRDCMKKMIAISVVFALTAAVAFAQPSVGGNMKLSTALLGGESANPVDTTYPYAGTATAWDAHVNVNFGDGDAGGMMRLWTKTNEWQPGMFTFWWWKPIPQLRLQLGHNPDGDWGHAQITGWGYNGEAQGGIALDEHRKLNGTAAIMARSASNSNYGDNRVVQWAPGVGGLGLNLSFYPVQGATINLHIPYASDRPFQETFSRLYIDGSYALPDIGTLRLAAQLAPGNHRTYIPSVEETVGQKDPNTHWRGDNESHDMSQFWLSFYLSALEGLGAELSLSYKLPYTTQDVKFVDNASDLPYNVGGSGYNGLPPNTTHNYPLGVGIGARYAISPDFNIKLRAGANFGGNQQLKDPAASRALANQRLQLEFEEEWYAHIPEQMFIKSDYYYEIKGDDINMISGEQKVKSDPLVWGLGILPSYKIGNLVVFLNAGIGVKHYGKQTILMEDPEDEGVFKNYTVSGKPGLYFKNTVVNDPEELEKASNFTTINVDVDWFVNPYVRIPAGSGQFYVGFRLYTDGSRIPVKYAFTEANSSLSNVDDKDKPVKYSGTAVEVGAPPDGKEKAALYSTKYQIKWEVPIGWNFYF
jgi:hypothetical protein